MCVGNSLIPKELSTHSLLDNAGRHDSLKTGCKHAQIPVNKGIMKQSTRYWPTVAARIPPELREKLVTKHPNSGDISAVIKQLIERYLQGKILGIVIKKKEQTCQ